MQLPQLLKAERGARQSARACQDPTLNGEYAKHFVTGMQARPRRGTASFPRQTDGVFVF